MATLLFFDTDHRYTLDGEELPSVSELCRFLSREIYGTVAQYTLDRAAERGSEVHRICQALDLYGKADVPDDVLPYVQAYVQFRKDHSVNWDAVEKAMHHPEQRYAGTLDRVGTIDGKRCIVDLKTSYQVQKPLAVAQLNLYRRMVEYQGESVDSLYILHLKKDGTYKLVDIEINEDVPAALLTLHNLTKKKARKRNVRGNDEGTGTAAE